MHVLLKFDALIFIARQKSDIKLNIKCFSFSTFHCEKITAHSLRIHRHIINYMITFNFRQKKSLKKQIFVLIVLEEIFI